MEKTSPALILFDGVCNLCNTWVQWVLKRDKHAQFRFAALQSDTGRQLLMQYSLNPDNIDTVVLIDNNRAYTHSDVALRVASRIGGIWSATAIFYIFPRSFRNIVYNWIARNRYRWFGRQSECWLPRPEWKERFV